MKDATDGICGGPLVFEVVLEEKVADCTATIRQHRVDKMFCQDGLAGSRVCRHPKHTGCLAVAPLLKKAVLNKPFACACHAHWVSVFCLTVGRFVEVLQNFVSIFSVASPIFSVAIRTTVDVGNISYTGDELGGHPVIIPVCDVTFGLVP